MEVINLYFGNIVFTKVEQKEGFTVYAAAIRSSFGDGNRQYALAFVPSHMGIRDTAYLSDLEWQSIQTRTLRNGYRLASQRWDVPRNLENPMFDISDRTEIRTRYFNPPLELILLHDPKKKTIFQHHNRVNLISALTSFRCVISITEELIPSTPITRVPDSRSTLVQAPVSRGAPVPYPAGNEVVNGSFSLI